MFFLITIFLVYGALNILFAFRPPPAWTGRFFRLEVPFLLGLILIFVPDRYTMLVGRLATGGLFFFAAAFFTFLSLG